MSITRISTEAVRILDANRHVEIHSVFANAVNLRAGERLITCTADVISAPHGLETSSAGLAQLQHLHRTAPADALDWHPHARCLSSRAATTVITATQRTTEFDPALPTTRRAPTSRTIGHLITYLTRVRAPTGFGDQWPALTAAPRMRAAVDALIDNHNDDHTVDDAVLQLIGRGPGLTPSGDDVLVGMIAALWFADEIDYSSLASLRRLVDADARRLTTDISAEYLRHACRGKVAGALHELLFALESADSSTTSDVVHRLRRYGHTSGMDCLLGVLTSLRHIPPAAGTGARAGRPAVRHRPESGACRNDPAGCEAPL